MKLKKIILLSLVLLTTASCTNQEHSHTWNYIDYNETYYYCICKEDSSHIQKEKHNYELINSSSLQNEYKCKDCGRNKIEYINNDGEYTLKIKEEKYLKEKLSEATSVYYKSDINGNYGNKENIFIDTLIPDEYEELEYITLNGYQYIDSEYIFLSSNFQIEIKALVDKTTFKGNMLRNGLFGAVKLDNDWVGTAFIEYYKDTMFAGTSSYKTLGSSIFNTPTSFKMSVTSNSYKVYVDNNLTAQDNYSPCYINSTMYIGNVNMIDNPYNNIGLSGNIYSCKLIDENVVIRNYIPVRRIEDNVYYIHNIDSNITIDIKTKQKEG